MSQLEIPLYRSTDPSTSKDAAAKVESFRASHEAKIFDCLSRTCGGSTYREIAAYCKLEPVAVGRRLVAMERKKLIRRKRHETTGQYASVDGMALWFIV